MQFCSIARTTTRSVLNLFSQKRNRISIGGVIIYHLSVIYLRTWKEGKKWFCKSIAIRVANASCSFSFS